MAALIPVALVVLQVVKMAHWGLQEETVAVLIPVEPLLVVVVPVAHWDLREETVAVLIPVALVAQVAQVVQVPVAHSGQVADQVLPVVPELVVLVDRVRKAEVIREDPESRPSSRKERPKTQFFKSC